MVVVFSVAKTSICFVEYNSHDSLQARLIEGIGHRFPTKSRLNRYQMWKMINKVSSWDCKDMLAKKKSRIHDG